MILSTPYAILAYRVIEADDDICFDYPELAGGIFVTSLTSKRAGNASELLRRLVKLHGDKPMVLNPFAASGEHERLRNLYRRFGFSGDNYEMMRKP